MSPGALARHGEDRELALIALVTPAFSRHHFASDAVRPCCLVGQLADSADILPPGPGVVAILVLGVERSTRRVGAPSGRCPE